MLFKEDISIEKAQELFIDSEKVLQFIAEIKWKKGFACRNCGHTNYCDGKTPTRAAVQNAKRRISSRQHHISQHKISDQQSILHCLQCMCTGSDLSTYNYSDQLGLNQMTCWKFRKRIQNCITKLEYTEKNKIQNILLSEYK